MNAGQIFLRVSRILFSAVLLVVAGPLQADADFEVFEFQDVDYRTLKLAEQAMRDASGVYGPYMEPIRDPDFPVWNGTWGKQEYRYAAKVLPADLGEPTWYDVGAACGFGACGSEGAAIDQYVSSKVGVVCFRNIRATGDWVGPALTSGSSFPSLHVGYKKRYDYEYATVAGGDTSCAGQTWSPTFMEVGRYTPIGCPPGYGIQSAGGWYECRPTQNTLKSIFVKEVPGCCTTHGNPIDLVRGGKQHTETLYSSDWMEYRLHYNSRANFGRYGQYGPGWVDNFSMQVIPSTNGYVSGIRRPDGSFLTVNYIGGKYYVQTTSGLDFIRDGYSWKVRTAAGDLEVYNQAGHLLRIERQGRTDLEFVRDAKNRLIRIVNEDGRFVELVRDAGGRLEKFIDTAGGEVALDYGDLGQLETITWQDDTTQQFVYEDEDHPRYFTGIIDGNGDRMATYEYENGLIVASERAGGTQRIETTYNLSAGGSHHQVAVTEVTGNIVTYTFQHAAQGSVPVMASAPCAVECNFNYQSATYDANRRLATTTDFNGHVTRYVRDQRGRVAQRTEAEGTPEQRVTTTIWHPVFPGPTSITEPGRTTGYTYDSAGNRLTETITDTATGESRTTTWTYDTMGNVLTVDGPRTGVNDVTTYTYDASGRLATVTNGLGHLTQYNEYDVHGNPLEIIDPNGVITRLTYDARQRLKTRTVAYGTADAATSTFDYDPAGQLVKTTLPDGSFIAYEYDTAHRLVAIEDAAGNRIDYTLDALGNRVEETVSGPGGAVFRKTMRDYDELNRLVAESGPAGSMMSYGYDLEGNRTSVTDADSNATSHHYDALDRLFQTIDVLSGVTTYAYDARDNLAHVIDPRGVTTAYTYNGFNELIATDSPDAGITAYTYDKAGNRVSQTDARGITALFSYDALNRLTFVDWPGTAQDIAYEYDGTPNAIGRLVAIEDETGRTEYAYDTKGNLVSKAVEIGGTWLPLTYGYDDADRLASITYPDNTEFRYQRDAAGHVTAVISIAPDGTQSTLLSGIEYAPFGPITDLNNSNGIQETRSHDAEGRITGIHAGSVLDLGYTWEATGNIIAITDNLDAAGSQAFDYDALYRLTSANGRYGQRGYSYDAVGNRLMRSIIPPSGVPHDETYAYAPNSNRLVSVTTPHGTATYQYDANGNTTSDGEHSYSYDARNRLISADGTNQYMHNALGQRASKTTADGTMLFLYDEAGHLLGEYDAAGVPVRQYVWLGDRPVAMLAAGVELAAGEPVVLDNDAASYSGNWVASTEVGGYAGDNYYHRAPDGVPQGAILADNDAAGFSVTGDWAVSTSVNGYLGAGYRHHAANGTSPDALVQDTDAASISGAWNASMSVSGYLGANYLSTPAGDGSARVTWSFLAPAAGSYHIQARWTTHGNRATDATYRIQANAGETVAVVNQRHNGASWQTLATLDLAAGENVTVTLDNAANGYVIADAMQLAPVGAQPNTATWQIAVPADGHYTVYARWTAHPNRASDATYRVAHAEGEAAVSVNQRENGAAWQALGRYAFSAQDGATVTLTDAANGYVIADGVMLVPDSLPADRAEWTITVSGTYRIEARWTAHPNRASDTAYRIEHAGGTTSIGVDQRSNGEQWNSLGEYAFNGSGSVSLVQSESGYVVADAIRLVPLVPFTSSSVAYAIHADHMNTPQVVTDPDQNIVWRASYTPFGEVSRIVNALDMPLRFPGQYQDAETGLNYNYFRSYDTGTGRYTQSDPIGLDGGLNTFVYAYANSVNYIDPLGLWVERCSRELGGPEKPAAEQNWSNPARHDYLNVSGTILSYGPESGTASNMAWGPGLVSPNEKQDNNCKTICGDDKFDSYVLDAAREIGAPTYCALAFKGTVYHLAGARNCQTWIDDVIDLAKDNYLENEDCPSCFK